MVRCQSYCLQCVLSRLSAELRWWQCKTRRGLDFMTQPIQTLTFIHLLIQRIPVWCLACCRCFSGYLESVSRSKHSPLVCKFIVDRRELELGLKGTKGVISECEFYLSKARDRRAFLLDGNNGICKACMCWKKQ